MSADAVQDMVLEAGDLYGLGRKHSARKVVTGAEALMLDQMWGIRHQMCFFGFFCFANISSGRATDQEGFIFF